jgi:hypothetical protein
MSDVALTLRHESLGKEDNEHDVSWKPFHRNHAGNQARPVELGRQPEASLAWGRETALQPRLHFPARRRQRVPKPCDSASKVHCGSLRSGQCGGSTGRIVDGLMRLVPSGS